MKKLTVSLIAALMAFSVNVNANSSQSYKLITVATYLNFYLMNLNACEDYHPAARQDAYKAESTLYPFFAKLDAKVAALKINQKDKDAIANTVSNRRAKLNAQIEAGEFTLEHCNAVIGIVNAGLDPKVLEAVN